MCKSCIFEYKFRKGLSIKDVRSQEEGSLSSADIFLTRGFFSCGRLHFLVQKLRIFRNLWCVCSPHGQGGKRFSQCERPLWAAPNLV